MNHQHYGRLIVMAALSFLSMYVLMYAMVDTRANVYSNWNQAYMASLMTAPMIVIELALMRAMFTNRRLNALILAASGLVGIASFLLIRQQAGITDTQFLRSMIPHHGGAILMCGNAPVEDAEILELCRGITASQQSEIDQMKAMLRRLEE